MMMANSYKWLADLLHLMVTLLLGFENHMAKPVIYSFGGSCQTLLMSPTLLLRLSRLFGLGRSSTI